MYRHFLTCITCSRLESPLCGYNNLRFIRETRLIHRRQLLSFQNEFLVFHRSCKGVLNPSVCLAQPFGIFKNFHILNTAHMFPIPSSSVHFSIRQTVAATISSSFLNCKRVFFILPDVSDIKGKPVFALIPSCLGYKRKTGFWIFTLCLRYKRKTQIPVLHRLFRI